MSRIWLVVKSIRPQKIEACCAINSAANVTPRMMPKNLARLPVSIFSATQPMASASLLLLIAQDSFDAAQRQLGNMFGQVLRFVTGIFFRRDQHLNYRIGN